MEQIANQSFEGRLFSGRVVAAIIFIVVLFLVLLAQIYQLQIVRHQFYADEALGNQMAQRPIVPLRGKIFDRGGKILAENQLSYRLIITPEKAENIDKTLRLLKRKKFITEGDIERFWKNQKYHKNFQTVALAYHLSEETLGRFLVARDRFKGVDVEAYFRRIYPQEKSLAHTLGYVAAMSRAEKNQYDRKVYRGSEFVGKTGVEKLYEPLLHGIPGSRQIERNVEGREVDSQILKTAADGQDIYLTIDLSLQQKAEELLAGKRGAIVMMNVKDGEVLVLASMPNYDPNLFVDGISEKNYQTLLASADTPLIHRAAAGIYPPGSTIKPMVALAGLEGKMIAADETIFCPGWYQLPNYKRKFNDWKRDGHGSVNAQDAIAQSCDVYFYELANRIGIDQMSAYLAHFGFGAKTGIDLPGEKSGILPTRKWKQTHKGEPWYRGETLIAGIGQGFMAATPLQLASATAALANKGVVVRPRLLKNIRLNGALTILPEAVRTRIPIENVANWENVAEGMRQTIYHPKGTARRLNKGLRYTMAGKTGTAQVFTLDPEETYIAEKYPEHLRDHALFTAFAPFEAPEVALAVIVENAGSGSAEAAPLARKMLDAYFAKMPETANLRRANDN